VKGLEGSCRNGSYRKSSGNLIETPSGFFSARLNKCVNNLTSTHKELVKLYIYILFINLLLRRIASGGHKRLRAYLYRHLMKRDVRYRDTTLSDSSLVTAANCLKLQNFVVTEYDIGEMRCICVSMENNRHCCKQKPKQKCLMNITQRVDILEQIKTLELICYGN
jgi:hypothetical protein